MNDSSGILATLFFSIVEANFVQAIPTTVVFERRFEGIDAHIQYPLSAKRGAVSDFLSYDSFGEGDGGIPSLAFLADISITSYCTKPVSKSLTECDRGSTQVAGITG